MKISKSKKELARIISENGGWRDCAEFSALEERAGDVWFCKERPKYKIGLGIFSFNDFIGAIDGQFKFSNWHQTILSREEYLHLYPAAEAAQEHEIQSEIMGIAQVDDINVVESKPTIEQLAADYRNILDFARRKQEEADAARADAEAKLAELIAAGKELNLVISVAEEDPELVIAELTDLKIGDEVDATYRGIERVVGRVMKIDFGDKNQPVFVSDGERSIWATEWKFIRRP